MARLFKIIMCDGLQDMLLLLEELLISSKILKNQINKENNINNNNSQRNIYCVPNYPILAHPV